MIEKYLWIAGSIVFLVLGSLHMYYTFFTHRFNPRNRNLAEEMKNTSPVLTKETTMWKAWIGFNASHSSGAMFIGLINLILAIQFFPVLSHSSLLLLNIITILFYLWLVKKYWFSIPFIGILITACCFIISTLIIFFK